MKSINEISNSISRSVKGFFSDIDAVSYTHLRAHETKANLVCRLLLEKNYAVRDKQDVLAMCSLQYAAQLERSKNQSNGDQIVENDKVQELIDIIDVHLSAY